MDQPASHFVQDSIAPQRMSVEDQSVAQCPLHQQPWTCYCEDRREPLCKSCVAACNGFPDQTKPIAAVIQETRNRILGLLETAKALMAQLDKAKGSPIRTNLSSSRVLRRTISNDVTSQAKPVVRAIDIKKSVESRKRTEDQRLRVKSLCEEVEKLLEQDSTEAVLQIKHDYLHKFYAAFDDVKKASESRSSSPKTTQSDQRKAAPLRAKYQRSISASSPGPFNGDPKGYVCAVTSGLSKDGSVNSLPGKETKLRLFLWSRDIRSQAFNPDTLSCTVTNGKDEEPQCELKMRQLRTDSFEVTFTAAQEGLYRFNVYISGATVSGSPVPVVVKAPSVREDAVRESLFSPCSSIGVKTSRSLSQKSGSDGLRRNSNRLSELDEEDFLLSSIGGFGRDFGQFLNPQGVCVTDDGCVAVTDSNIGCIQVFSPNGKFLQRIGDRGRRAGQVFRPTGIAFLPRHLSRTDTAGYVVADYENRSVLIYDTAGNCLSSFGSAKLTGPKGVAVAQNGDILVVDNRSSSIFVFRNGKFYKKIWSPSSTGAHLAGPHYISVSETTGEIFVSDFHHHTIKVFDCQYIYRRSFGSFSVKGGMGSFSGPTGVATDQHGIVVADWGSGRVQVFDYSGSFLAYVTTLSSPLYGPQGLAVGPDGSVYVCDSGNHTVRVYRHPLTQS